jgi:uncharacterized protein (TIGR03086 family)
MDLNRVLDSTLAVMTNVRPDQLDGPTPCASWDVRALINHCISSTRGFASLVNGDDGAGQAADPDYTTGDFVAAYRESIRVVLSAFAADGVLDRTVKLPFGEFSGAELRGLAANDQFTHGWDLARATGQSTALDSELAADLLDQARAVITEAYRGPDGVGLFGPVQEAPAGASAADRLAAFLGRTV